MGLIKEKIKGVCRLCQCVKDLRNSHIIPEFMYQNIYDYKPKRFKALTVNFADKQDSHQEYKQKGIREYLLCDDCELILSKYENYAAETIYSKNNKNKAICINSLQIGNSTYKIHKFIGFSYTDFKLFLLSLLWRIIISNKFKALNVDNDTKEKLRIAILKQDPLKYNEFGCLLQTIKYDNGSLASGFIYGPLLYIENESRILEILIDGFMYRFFLNPIDLPMSEYFLNLNGEVNIFEKRLFDDITLLNNLKIMFDHLKH